MAGIENPVTLETALVERDDRGLHTIAAFLISRAAVLSAPFRDIELAVPAEEAEQLGFNTDLPFQQLDGRVDIAAVPGPGPEEIEQAARDPAVYFERLAELIRRAEDTGTVPDILSAIRYGMESPDGIVRVAALSSGMKVFNLSSLAPLARLDWFVQRGSELSDLTRDVFQTLLQSTTAATDPAAGQAKPPPAPPPRSPGKGLVLVHGTHFEHNADPDWYFPGTGDLHNYIAPHRTDIYSNSDYFEWEGRWSDRGRAVAAKSLLTWIRYHGLEGCDIVAHSHGGNVVMKAAETGLRLRRVLFLSCPVHWQKYNLLHGNINQAYGARVRFDFVVFADGGAQKFPAAANLVEQRQVGGWFGGHSDTRASTTWQSDHMEDMLL